MYNNISRVICKTSQNKERHEEVMCRKVYNLEAGPSFLVRETPTSL